MRLVAVLAFTAWGTAQLFPDSAAAGALNDVAILLFVIDAASIVISESRHPMSSAVKVREVPARLLRECVPVLASVKAALRAACGRP